MFTPWWRGFLVTTGLVVLNSCATIGYYSQAVGGHLDIMLKSRPVAQVTADERLPDAVRHKLQIAQEARAFAMSELHLPRSRSYERYADLGRTAVVWNVIAAPAFSVQPLEWCYPVAGCFAYRGYFSRVEADHYAKALAARGHDVFVAPATAYSTLGWFNDPLLSTMLRRSEADLAATMFHELAHQKLHVDDDTAFNEAFAETVAEEGLRRFYSTRPEDYASYARRRQRVRAVAGLLVRARERLEALYTEPVDREEMALRKNAIFESLRADYTGLRAEWGGYAGLDGWVPDDINNAHLALTATYHQLVPGFKALLVSVGGNLDRFYEVTKELAQLPRKERREYLEALVATSEGTPA